MVVRAGASGRRRVKQIKRKKSFGASNLKLQGRRRAATEFNELLTQLGADVLILGRVMAWQPLGKRMASWWQAARFFGKRPFYHSWGGKNVRVFDVSGFGNPAQVSFV